MAKNIVPRWEWRTFGSSFEPHLALIQNRELGNYKKSCEIYILSKNNSNNIKIRNGVLEVKTLQAISDEGLERWYPAMKAHFPLNREHKAELERFLGVRIPVLPQSGGISLTGFLRFVEAYASCLRTVTVEKARYIYVIEACIVEFVKAVVQGRRVNSICVEQTDARLVKDVMSNLGFSGAHNISYVKALKKATRFYNCENIYKI